MKLAERGINTSIVEVVSISPHGIWLHVRRREFFLSYVEFPWFHEARVADIYDVHVVHGHFLRWERLDVDLDLDSLGYPDRYPLKSR